jgi:FXSXX-COOH protein
LPGGAQRFSLNWRDFFEGKAVEYVTAEPSELAVQNSVVDVRDVPLEQLATDSESQRLVRAVLASMEGPVRVAMFNSAI